MRRLPLLVGLGCLGGLLIACYGSVLFRDHLFGYRDAGHFYYPLYLRVQQEWAAGRIPLWEAEENAGMPLLGNPTAAVLYPGKLLFAIAPSFAWGVRLYTVAHTLLAVAGMYVLMRSWQVSRAGSGIAALAYGFGSPILFQYCNIVFLVGAAWLPLGFRAADRWLRLGRRWALGELALVLALQTLGGEPQAAYVLGVCAGGYAIGLSGSRRPKPGRWPAWAVVIGGLLVVVAWTSVVLYAAYWFPTVRPERPGNRPPPSPLPWMRYVNGTIRLAWAVGLGWLVVSWSRRPGRRALPTRLVGLLAASGLSAAMMAVQLVPVLEFTSQSARATGEGPHDIYPFSLEPVRVAELAFPNLFGSSLHGNHLWLTLVPPAHSADLWVPSLYLGAPVLVLALAAVGFRGGPPWRAWLTAIVLASLLAALGKFGSPIWMARNIPAVAETIGRHDDRSDTAIRLDKQLRDGDGGFYWLLATALPGFKEFRYPSKLLTFTCLGLAGLAGLGWDRVVAGRGRRAIGIAGVLLGVGAAGLAFALTGRGLILKFFEGGSEFRLSSPLGPFEPAGAWGDLVAALVQGTVVLLLTLILLRLVRSRPALASTLAVVLVSVDLGVANANQILTVPRSMFETPPELLEIIERAERAEPTPGGLYRVHRTPLWDPFVWRETPSPARYRDFVRWERKTLQPKYGIPYGLCYTLTEGTAELYDYMFFFSIFEGVHAPEIGKRFLGDPSKKVITHARRGYDLWNTRYFILPYVRANDEHRSILSFLYDSEVLAPDAKQLEGPENREALEDWQKSEDWQVLRNRSVYPRAWVVRQVKIRRPITGLNRREREPIMEEILYQNDPLWHVEGLTIYDPKTLAWIETDEPADLARFQVLRPFDPDEIPKITRYEPQRVEMSVDLKMPGLVILADAYYPGWKLTIDGAPATIYRTNRMMRGAAVEAGKHTLVYTYEPGSFRAGAVLTLIGLFALGTLGVWSVRRPVVPILDGSGGP